MTCGVCGRVAPQDPCRDCRRERAREQEVVRCPAEGCNQRVRSTVYCDGCRGARR